MNIAALLAKAAGIPVAAIEMLIQAGAAAAPEFSDEAAKLIAWMDTAVTPEALVKFGAVLFSEASDIAHGQIHPADHPSDSG